MEVMIMGASRGVFKAIERMGKSNGGRGGRIVNVASVAGLTVHIFLYFLFSRKNIFILHIKNYIH